MGGMFRRAASYVLQPTQVYIMSRVRAHWLLL